MSIKSYTLLTSVLNSKLLSIFESSVSGHRCYNSSWRSSRPGYVFDFSLNPTSVFESCDLPSLEKKRC